MKKKYAEPVVLKISFEICDVMTGSGEQVQSDFFDMEGWEDQI